MKKWIAGLLALVLCVSCVACNTDTPEQTDDMTNDVQTTTDTTTASETTDTTATTATTETSGSEDPNNPGITTDIEDLESVKAGSYVTVYYNGVSVDVTVDAKKGLGSKETVTLTATMKNDYTFDGWSQGNAMANGTKASSKELTYTFDASANVKVYLNTSMTLRYHANGGEFKNGFSGEEKYSVVFFQNPNTLREKNYIKKEKNM